MLLLVLVLRWMEERDAPEGTRDRHLLACLRFVFGPQSLQLGEKKCLEGGCISTVHQLQCDLLEAGHCCCDLQHTLQSLRSCTTVSTHP